MELRRQPAYDAHDALSHDAMSLEIATGIMIDGVYVVELDPGQLDQLDDLRVAAKRAEVRFRFRARIHVAELPTLTVTITRADAAGPATANRVTQLRAMLQALDRNHLRLVQQPEPD